MRNKSQEEVVYKTRYVMQMAIDNKDQVIPEHQIELFFKKKNDYVVYIFVYNEKKLLSKLLQRIESTDSVGYDIMIGDDGSIDNSVTKDLLEFYRIRGCTRLIRNEGLSGNIKVAIKWLMGQEYKGVIFINGNNRDDPKAIPNFIENLEEGYGYVQGSRFIKGGKHINTPLVRYLAIRLIHAPLFSIASGKLMTDTTSGFSAYSMKFLSDKRLFPFQRCFKKYEIERYLGWKAIKLGYPVKEIPVIRAYPVRNYTTHIRPGFGWLQMLKPLLMLLFGQYR